ncbi:MAG TPA: glycine cleavage system protein GcvH [Chitinispirillaceae bacterium]|nr:glycine cleavage system protein GcvH [Chitinispirillaceae bacterium]
MTPGDRKYTRTHEWVKIEGNMAIVGITEHAQDALGDITFVELPKVGSEVEKEKECGVIESVKAASDLYSPISGSISEVNTELETTPEVINSDPYGKGWIFKITNLNEAELDSLMDAAAYESFLETEE